MDIHPLLNVRSVPETHAVHCDFSKKPWADIPAEELMHHMGEDPVHRPLTRFKIAYSPGSINLIFQVSDHYVRAVAGHYQGPVYQDSCVEFFFSPGPSVDRGYFNLEINCCGTALFEFHPAGTGECLKIPEKAFQKITIVPSLEGPVEPEIQRPLAWSVACRLPIDILRPYSDVTLPSPGACWRANFYKCADKTSRPHWLTWAPVHFPTPRFHLPEYFGLLKFI